MQITAKFNSRCPTCNGFINAGSTVEWASGQKAKHVACAKGAAAPAKAPAPVAQKPEGAKGSNKKAGHCENCGSYLAAFAGKLYKCIPDGDCMKHFDSDDGGWHVVCLDKDACKANREANKAAKAKAGEEAKAKDAQEKAERDALEAQYKALHEDFKVRGLEQVTCFSPDGLAYTKGTKLIEAKSGMFDVSIHEVAFSDGTTGYIENANGHDDWRTYWWLSKPSAHAWRLAAAAKAGITVTAANEYMEKYSKCYGADVYQAVLDEASKPADIFA